MQGVGAFKMAIQGGQLIGNISTTLKDISDEVRIHRTTIDQHSAALAALQAEIRMTTDLLVRALKQG